MPFEHGSVRKHAPEGHHGLPGCSTCSVGVPRAVRDTGRMEVVTPGQLDHDRIDPWMTKEGYNYASGTCSGRTAAACGVNNPMAPSEYYAETPGGAAIIMPDIDKMCWLEEEEEEPVSVGVSHVVERKGFASDLKTRREQPVKELAKGTAGWLFEPEEPDDAATEASETDALASSQRKHKGE